LYTGCRADEITRIFVKHIDLERNEIFIDGTKNKGSRRKMPIIPPLYPILEKLIASKTEKQSLINYSVPQIRRFLSKIKEKTGIICTLKDFRHTCATNFKDAGIPTSVYFRWFGWCNENMALQVYTHETDYEMNLSQEWAKNIKE
jgi:integrase